MHGNSCPDALEALDLHWRHVPAAARARFKPTQTAVLLSLREQPPRGGLRDKPGKSADYYHTCYCLR